MTRGQWNQPHPIHSRNDRLCELLQLPRVPGLTDGWYVKQVASRCPSSGFAHDGDTNHRRTRVEIRDSSRSFDAGAACSPEPLSTTGARCSRASRKIEPRSVARWFQSGQSSLGHPRRGWVGKDLAVRLNQAPPGLAPFGCSTARRVAGVRSGLSCRHRPDPQSTFGTLLDLTDSSDDLLPVQRRKVGAWRDVWRDLVGQLPYDSHGTDLSGHRSAVQSGRTVVSDDAGGVQSNDRH